LATGLGRRRAFGIRGRIRRFLSGQGRLRERSRR